MDYDGHIETLGSGWVTDGDIIYSNTSYKKQEPKYVAPYTIPDYESWYTPTKKSDKKSTVALSGLDSYIEQDVIDEDELRWMEWESYYNDKTGLYDWDEVDCPAMHEYDCSCCDICSNQFKCYEHDKYAV